MNKRLLLVVLLSLVLIVGLLGFAQEKTKITMWAWGSPEKWMGNLVATFNAAYPNYSLNIVPKKATEYNSILATSLQGGAGPDVFVSRINPMPAQFAKAGFVEPLEKLVPLLADYDPSTLVPLSYESHVYAVPYATVGYAIFYNVDVFKKYNLTVPKTWDEFITLCDKLQAVGVAPISISNATWVYTEIFHPAIAASFLSDQWLKDLVAGKVNFTDKAFVRTFEAAKQLEKYFIKGWQGMSYADAWHALAKGEAAMKFEGNWMIPEFRSAGFNFDVFLCPPPADLAKAGPRMYWRLDGGWAFNAKLTGAKREAALDFINFAAGPLAQEILSRDMGLMVVAPGVRYAHTDPVLAKMMRFRQEYGVKIQYGCGGPFDFVQPPISSVLGKAVQGVLLGVLTPEQAAKQIQDTVNQQEH